MLLTQHVRVAACQLPPVWEDVESALSWINFYATRAETEGSQIVCFPECFLQGYLLEEDRARRSAIDLRSEVFAAMLERLANIRPILVIGMIEADAGAIFNTAVVIERGRLVGRYRKVNLLSKEQFFGAGTSCPVFEACGVKFGINICSDTRLGKAIAAEGAQLIICPANNMMPRADAQRWKDRHNPMRAELARETGCWLVSADVTGKREESISLGPTAIIDSCGRVVDQVPLGKIAMVTADIVLSGGRSVATEG